jgi:hypothetical protein
MDDTDIDNGVHPVWGSMGYIYVLYTVYPEVIFMGKTMILGINFGVAYFQTHYGWGFHDMF